MGIEGNKEVDYYAKYAAKIPPSTTSTSYASYRMLVRK